MALAGGLKGGFDDGAVLRVFADDVVGGEDPHHGVGILLLQNLRGQADRGGRVALHGLGENLPGGHVGELLNNGVTQVVIGKDPDAFGGDHGGQAVHRSLNQAALADHVEYLFGGAFPAARPEARSAPTGENQSVVMSVHVIGGSGYCNG